MGIQKAVWMASIVAVVSATVSIATVCVVLPKIVANPTDEKPATLPEPMADDPRADELAAEKDREAIAAIKGNLDIDVFKGTVFDEPDPVGQPESDPSAESVASEALSDTADRLRADGQHGAAELVRAAADEIRSEPVRAASSDSPTKSR